MSFQFQNPYLSTRLPVFARNIVATSHPLAAQAGLRMLWQGGNAVDAAIASAIAITVVEPTMNGIGADAFCILWDGTKLVGLNASGHSPELMTPDKYEGMAKIPDTGWGCVSVPGAVSLWMTLHARYGKLPFADLFEPGIKYAHDGFRVSYMVAKQWDRAIARLKGQEDWVKAFLPNGRAPQPGEVWKFPDQAKTLAKIAESKGEAFYRGELAEAMEKHAKAGGGGDDGDRADEEHEQPQHGRSQCAGDVLRRVLGLSGRDADELRAAEGVEHRERGHDDTTHAAREQAGRCLEVAEEDSGGVLRRQRGEAEDRGAAEHDQGDDREHLHQ